MKRVLVVGSGASGVHFALTVLKKGYDVTMVDVGYEHHTHVMPEANFETLKERLPDPVAYFLGNRFDGVLLPDLEREYYGIPPHKQYIFDVPRDFGFSATGFAPLFSFAQGGLAEAWTAGCYPFNGDELAEFPFGYQDIGPHYGEVAHRIGVSGTADDLAPFMPLHDHLLEPLRLDAHSRVLLEAYARNRRRLNEELGCYLGLTRVATLSRDRSDRKACAYLGRCLWGCPVGALYTPFQTLLECRQYPNFTYLGGVRAQYFTVDGRGCAIALVVTPVDGGPARALAADRIVLAAGTLSSSRIVLRSVYEATGRTIQLHGLMDNRQLLIPFLNVRMLGRGVRTDSYQYHLLGIRMKMGAPAESIHGQITTLKAALMHPIIQRLPFDLRTATVIARATHAALGVVNVNLHDTRRPENFVTLIPEKSGSLPERLAIRYAPPSHETERIQRTIRRVKRVLWALGCIVPPGMLHVRPMGASVHYAGTLPMTREPTPWTTDALCRSRDFENVYLVDGSTFPFLPAKNITFTLMANAVRVAERAF
jgi:choline dehydrogenase-like flavoprotein